MTCRVRINGVRLAVSLLLMFCMPGISAAAPLAAFSWPVSCIPGVDCSYGTIRIAYPDISQNGKSAKCGPPGYFGHTGTDIVVNSVEQGVTVLAAANGVVLWNQDGLYDRCPNGRVNDCDDRLRSRLPPGDPTGVSLGFNAGNYLVIEHSINKTRYLTLYAHLRKGSLLVAPGQQVKRGEKIAQVGSSGNAQTPHLHFGVFRMDGKVFRVVDPWSGPCNTTSDGLWVSDPPYRKDSAIPATASGKAGQGATP